MSSSPPVTRTRESYVVEIMGLMREAEWVRGKTCPALAKEWGLAQSTVEGYASEASRRVLAEVQDKDAVTGRLGAKMSEMVSAGSRRFVDGNDSDAGRVAVAAGQTWAKLVGAEAPQRLEVSLVAQQFASLPPAAKSAKLREQAARLLAAADHIDKLEARHVIDEDQGSEGTGEARRQLGAGEGGSGAG